MLKSYPISLLKYKPCSFLFDSPLWLQLLLARLESAYSLIPGAHEIWEQGLGTFMISRPIKQGSD